MLNVQDNKCGLIVGGLPAMVHGGGRVGAVLLTEMVALLSSPGRILLLAIQSN